MRAWYDFRKIEVEGTPEEWEILFHRFIELYKQRNADERVIEVLKEIMSEQKALIAKRPPRSRRRPDLEWYDRR